MLYTKFQDHRLFASGEEDFKVFYYIWAWRQSWSCDHDILKELSFPRPTESPHKNLASVGPVPSEKKMFENVDRWTTYHVRRTADANL